MAQPARIVHVIPATQDHTRLETAVEIARGVIDESYGLDPTYALSEALILLGREDLR